MSQRESPTRISMGGDQRLLVRFDSVTLSYMDALHRQVRLAGFTIPAYRFYGCLIALGAETLDRRLRGRGSPKALSLTEQDLADRLAKPLGGLVESLYSKAYGDLPAADFGKFLGYLASLGGRRIEPLVKRTTAKRRK